MTKKDAQTIRDPSPFGRYYHFMLNMADDDLDLYEYRLLGHYRRVCGANNVPCEETVRETAEAIKGMSAAKVSTTRRALAEKGWVTLTPGKGREVSITLVDRMLENIQRFAPCSPHERILGACSPHEHAAKSRSPGEQRVHHVNAVFTRRTTCSPREHRTLYIRINNRNQPNQNQPTTTDSPSPAVLGSDDARQVVVGDLELILPEIRKLHLTQDVQQELLAKGAEYALAVAWAAQGPGARYPAGLAVSMLRGGGPPELAIEQAKIALETGVIDQAAADRELRNRELESFQEQAREIAAAQESQESPPASPATHAESAPDPEPGAPNGLDEKPPGCRLTWREVWAATLVQLRMQFNASTYSNWIDGAKAISYADGVLTIQVRHVMAKEMIESKYRSAIEDNVRRLTATEVQIEFVIAPALEVVHAGV